MDRAPQNILIVDDDAADRALYKTYLSRSKETENHIFYEAASGREGLKILETALVDCVLLDYMLPDTDGLQVLKALTQDHAFLPVVIMTGHGNEILAVEAMRAGAQDYVPKNTISPQILRRAVRNAIERSSLLLRIDAQNRELESARQEAEEGRRKAVEADRAKSDFLATMSHEIRTPMNGIIGMAELLGYTRLDNKQKQYLCAISASGELLLRIINDILDFSKIEAAELMLEERPVKLEDLLAEVIQIVTGRANENRVELILNWPHQTALPLIKADPLRLRQILLNLVGNAIKFTHDGHVLIHVRILEQSAESIHLHFEIHDTGIGIPPDKIEKIFSKFTQVDSSTTREYGGTGLGLAICKRLVELMAGQIGVRSDPGKGSTFWFDLNFPLVGKGKADTDAESRAQDISRKSAWAGKRVLIVDDSDVNLDIFGLYIRAAGMEVEVARTGAEALKILRAEMSQEKIFDVLLIDEGMPKMDGETLCRKIAEQPDLYGRAPCILMTAIGKIRPSSTSACAAYQLAKPVYPQALLASLEIALSGKQGQAFVDKTSMMESESLPQFGAHVLVAEDDRVSQRMASSILSALGCTCEIVCDGVEAVNRLKQEPKAFDLILMDWQMPNMDGHTAIQQIRMQKWGRALKIVALTANAIHGDREKCLKAGANDYLSKPVRITDMTQIFKRYVKTAS